MRKFLLVCVLGFLAGFTGLVWAQEPEKKLLTYDLGVEPEGDAADLPAWACGNLTITGFNRSTPTLAVQVNIPDEFLKEPVETRSREPGEIVTVSLKSGVRFVFYFRVRTVKMQKTYERESEGNITTGSYAVDAYNVTLVVRRLPAK